MTSVDPTDFDIRLAARSMIRVYGFDAAAEARRRADAHDADSLTWTTILDAIESLEAERVGPTEEGAEAARWSKRAVQQGS